MSRTSIHISIPKPCHEGWENMDATERGAFCHSCQKEVIDFSAMTDREVIEYLGKHKTGCGRFREDQVDTRLTLPRLDNGFLKWKALFLGLLPFVSVKAFSLPDQEKTPKVEKHDTIAPKVADAKLENPALIDTLHENMADTLVELKEIEVTGYKKTGLIMGDMVFIEKKIILNMPTNDEPSGNQTHHPEDVPHLSRRQERRTWLRHFLHLD